VSKFLGVSCQSLKIMGARKHIISTWEFIPIPCKMHARSAGDRK
jgi:hypothetical protein